MKRIYGVVHPLGSSAGGKPGQTLFFGFTLLAWRGEGEPLADGELYVRKPISKEAAKEWMALVNPYDVVSLDAELIDLGTRVVGEIVTFHGTTKADAALTALAAELQIPVCVTDEILGTLTLDRSLDRFDGEVVFAGSLVDLSISGADQHAVEPNLETARQLVRDQAEWLIRVKAFAACELLSLRNESWRDEDEPILTAEEFAQQLELDGIHVENSGRFEFWFDDGELFAGHCVVVRGEIGSGLSRADIEG